jgi:sigma-B regulation protein RsbU (phosphoserine phosphatase)
VMAKEVGGDLYDFLTFEDGSVGVTIGDVSGKGVPAALYMAKTIGDFRTQGRGEKTPAKTITKLNLTLVQEGASGMFVTLFYLVLSGDRKSLIFSSAGHHPLLKWSRKTGEITEHNTLKGKPLGIIPFKNLDEGTLAIDEGDLLLLYTDGYDEAMNKARQTFGKKRILETLKKNSKKSPMEIIQAFQEAVKAFAGSAPQHDDMTLIAIRIGSSAQLA